MNRVKPFIGIFLPLLFAFLSIGAYVFAWSPPDSLPPTGNVGAPLNVSSTAQTKSGGLILNTGGSTNGLIVDQGNVGIRDSSPASLFTVGSGDLFQVNSVGNLIRVNNIAYSWPSVQGASSTYLRNDGTGNLSWVSVAAGAPGGSNGQVQFNNSGAFAGDTNLFWDD